jgi:hypothetical protein
MVARARRARGVTPLEHSIYRPPCSLGDFSLRSAHCHWYSSITALIELPGPTDLLVSHRTSWGILPQTPVFSLRSARCHLHRSKPALAERPGPKDLLVNHRTWGEDPRKVRHAKARVKRAQAVWGGHPRTEKNEGPKYDD